MQVQNPTAGWYQNPTTGDMQWWDGSAWTGLVPPPAPTNNQEERSKPTGWMIAGWIGAAVFPVLGIASGIVLITRKHVAQGVVMIVISCVSALIWADSFSSASAEYDGGYS